MKTVDSLDVVSPTRRKRFGAMSFCLDWRDHMNHMSDYQIIDTNADTIGSCAICRYKSGKNEGRRRKLDWLKQRFGEGLRFKVLRSRKFGDIGMIEYAPGSHTWRPVKADGYLVVHCLMVDSKHTGKGLGTLLLESCLEDAEKSQCCGVAVVTSSDRFMAGSDLFRRAGFVIVDRMPPYELLVRKLRATAPDPRFIIQKERLRYRKGLTILAADQCPMVPKWVEEIADASRTLGLKPRVIRVESAKASRQLPTPYGVFCILNNGKVIAERPISATRFMNIMRTNAEPATKRKPGEPRHRRTRECSFHQPSNKDR